MAKTIEQLHADWCAARGTSAEAERAAWEAYQAAVKAEKDAEGSSGPAAPSNTHAVTTQKAKRSK